MAHPTRFERVAFAFGGQRSSSRNIAWANDKAIERPKSETPPLFVIGPEGDGQLVSCCVRQNYYIVDRLFAAAKLRMGGEHQQTVRISRTDGRLR